MQLFTAIERDVQDLMEKEAVFLEGFLGRTTPRSAVLAGSKSGRRSNQVGGQDGAGRGRTRGSGRAMGTAGRQRATSSLRSRELEARAG